VRLYPRPFREAYGDELKHVFRDWVRDGYRRRGVLGVIAVWVDVMPDLVASAADQHVEEDPGMALKFGVGILSGAGLIGGALWVGCGVLWLIGPAGLVGEALREPRAVLPLFFIGLQLVAFGLKAIFLAASRPWPVLARVLLLVGAGGGLITSLLWQSSAGAADWSVLMGGVVLQGLGLVLAGLGLLPRPETRWLGVLLIGLALGPILANTEDWRAVFLAVAGGLMVVLMAWIFRPVIGTHPGTPAVS
jgi:hypothetical protein